MKCDENSIFPTISYETLNTASAFNVMQSVLFNDTIVYVSGSSQSILLRKTINEEKNGGR